MLKGYLVIDFEATCADDGAVPRSDMEIIEIGAVLADAVSFRELGRFQSFVRPVRHPALTPFCTKLTTITQSDVDNAPHFAAMIAAFKAWLYPDYSHFVFCSWGDYDFHQLHQDCNFHTLAYPIGAPHINVKKRFAAAHGLRKKPGLGQAISIAGLAFDGTPHRALADAHNIARLLPYIFGEAQTLKTREA